VNEARVRWREQTIPSLDLTRLVFIDESGARTDMARRYARAPRGERASAAVPAGHWNTTTMVCAIGIDGPRAPFVLEGPIDADAFAVYCERVLAPALRPGDVVVLDNLGPHKDGRARAAIESAGACVLYLPPYSPDLNPIENMWSKVKALLRKAAARTLDALLGAIADALAAVTPADCRGFFKNCGYKVPATSS
jgi:transposase